MKTILLAILLLETICFSGCQFQRSSTEQRVVELPVDNPDVSFDAAAQMGQSLIAGGLGTDVHKQFPSLGDQQLKGVYLTWNAGDINGKKRVFFLTGIQYTGTLPEAKAIADYCESRVKEAVAARFPSSPTN